MCRAFQQQRPCRQQLRIAALPTFLLPDQARAGPSSKPATSTAGADAGVNSRSGTPSTIGRLDAHAAVARVEPHRIVSGRRLRRQTLQLLVTWRHSTATIGHPGMFFARPATAGAVALSTDRALSSANGPSRTGHLSSTADNQDVRLQHPTDRLRSQADELEITFTEWSCPYWLTAPRRFRILRDPRGSNASTAAARRSTHRPAGSPSGCSHRRSARRKRCPGI